MPWAHWGYTSDNLPRSLIKDIRPVLKALEYLESAPYLRNHRVWHFGVFQQCLLGCSLILCNLPREGGRTQVLQLWRMHSWPSAEIQKRLDRILLTARNAIQFEADNRNLNDGDISAFTSGSDWTRDADGPYRDADADSDHEDFEQTILQRESIMDVDAVVDAVGNPDVHAASTFDSGLYQRDSRKASQSSSDRKQPSDEDDDLDPFEEARDDPDSQDESAEFYWHEYSYQEYPPRKAKGCSNARAGYMDALTAHTPYHDVVEMFYERVVSVAQK